MSSNILRVYILTVLVILLDLCGNVLAAPSISGVSGTVSHGGTITISGSGFGTKSSAAPNIWDNCSGTNITDKWTGAWPDNCFGYGDSNYIMNYRTPAQVNRGISLPHNHITKYMCGAHWTNTIGYCAGTNVMLYYTYNRSLPEYWYISYYSRADDNWDFGANCNTGADGDNNYKLWNYSTGTSPYTGNVMTGNFYIDYTPQQCSKSPGIDGTVKIGMTNTYLTSESHPNQHANLWGGAWVKVEIEFYVNTSGGFIHYYENGKLVDTGTGNMDPMGGGANDSRVLAIGGFARSNTTNNWRYFADIYLDHTLQRVMIGNASTLANCTTLREIQTPTAWSNASITATVNQGGFSNVSNAYLYVFDGTGTANSTGYTITFGQSGGGSSDTTPPATPTGVTVTIIP